MSHGFRLEPKHRRVLIEQLERRLVLSTIYYVDPGGATGPIDGLSWATAFNDLQSTIALAQSGDIIRVAYGVYTPTSGTDRNATFNLKSGVEIDGSYAGHSNPSNRSVRDLTRYPTALSGDIGQTNDLSDNSYHVVTADQTSSTAILDGVDIQSGNANGTVGDGGGLLVQDNASATIRNCQFIGNHAASYGGEAYLDRATMLIGCQFSGDVAGTAGGGVGLAPDFSGTISNCNFASLHAPNGAGLAATTTASPAPPPT